MTREKFDSTEMRGNTKSKLIDKLQKCGKSLGAFLEGNTIKIEYLVTKHDKDDILDFCAKNDFVEFYVREGKSGGFIFGITVTFSKIEIDEVVCES